MVLPRACGPQVPIPEGPAGSTMPDLVTEQLHYDQLDGDGHPVGIRLPSITCTWNTTSPDSAQQVRLA